MAAELAIPIFVFHLVRVFAEKRIALGGALCFDRGVIPHLSSLCFVAVLALAAPATGRSQNANPQDPEPPPIPAIPGVPAMRETPRPKAPAASPGRPGAPGTPPFSALPARSKAEPIRPVFQAGNTYRFLVATELRPGSGGHLSMEQQVRYDAKVRVDGKAGVVLKARSERFDLTLSSGSSRLSYQSLKPEDQDSPLGRHLRATLHRSLDLTLDPSGRIDRIEVEGPGEKADLIEGIPAFGPDELARWVANLLQGIPGKPLAPGAQWTYRGDRRIGGQGSATFEIGFRHAGAVTFEGQNCLAIEFSGRLSGDLPDDGAEPVAFESGRLEGRLYIDPLDRMVRFSEQSVELWLGTPPPPEGQESRLSLSETTTLRLLHVVPTL